MDKWDREVPAPITWQEAQQHTRDAMWQAFRKSMKNKPTTMKLDMLEAYMLADIEINGTTSRATEVRVGNYINSLKRGGLLNLELEVIR